MLLLLLLLLFSLFPISPVLLKYGSSYVLRVAYVLLRRQAASDQTKGGVGRVYREHRGSVPESKRFDLTKIQLSPN